MFNRWRYGKTLDRQGPSGETALTAALKAGDIAAAADFIALGASPDQTNAQGEHPLFLALETGDFRIFRALVEANANVQATRRGQTLYSFAMERNLYPEALIIASAILQDAEYISTASACSMISPAPVFPPSRSVLFSDRKKPKR